MQWLAYWESILVYSPFSFVHCLETDVFQCHVHRFDISSDSVLAGMTWLTSLSFIVMNSVQCLFALLESSMRYTRPNQHSHLFPTHFQNILFCCFTHDQTNIVIFSRLISKISCIVVSLQPQFLLCSSKWCSIFSLGKCGERLQAFSVSFHDKLRLCTA